MSQDFGDFDDLLAANREFAASFDLSGFDGIAHAGVAIVTCMDSRLDPLNMVGLKPGDAKIFRNPGGRVTPQALEALVLGATCHGQPKPTVDAGGCDVDAPCHLVLHLTGLVCLAT